LMFLILISADQLEKFLRKYKPGIGGKLSASGLVVILIHDLLQHARLWRVENMSQIFTSTPVDISAEVLSVQDPVYTGALLAGFCVALLASSVLLFLIRRDAVLGDAHPGEL